MKHIKLFESFLCEGSDKKIREAIIDGKKYIIYKGQEDPSTYGIKDSSGKWIVTAIGDSFNPDLFTIKTDGSKTSVEPIADFDEDVDRMSLDEMLEFIDEGIKHFSNMKSVNKSDVKKSRYAVLFTYELHNKPEILNKFYIIAKLECGKENAKYSI